MITDNVGRQILMISGSFFGDKPIVYVQYLKGTRTVMKKLRIVDSYTDRDGKFMDVSSRIPGIGSRLYVELPTRPVNASSSRYDIVIFSGIGYGGAARVPLGLVSPAFD